MFEIEGKKIQIARGDLMAGIFWKLLYSYARIGTTRRVDSAGTVNRAPLLGLLR